MTADRPEFDRIARFFRPLVQGYSPAGDLSDDAAVLPLPPPDHQLVVTTDAMVEGVHFLRDTDPARIARKLLRVNLSDLAAMGADPVGYSLVTALPASVGEAWLARFVTGLADDQARFGFPLTGGDSVSIAGPIVLSVTALGQVPTGQAVGRNGAQPGDVIWVSGTLGDARLALVWALAVPGAATPPQPDAGARAFLTDRLELPTPRLGLGRALRGVATAMMDVSDGLGGDLRHILAASRVGARLDLSAVPASSAAASVLAAAPVWRAVWLSGGDDYELLFTAPPARSTQVLACATLAGVPVTAIGEIVAAPDDRADPLMDAGGLPMGDRLRGWDHFAAS